MLTAIRRSGGRIENVEVIGFDWVAGLGFRVSCSWVRC